MARLAAATGLLTVLGTTPAGAADEWQKVGADSRSGVSGIAYEGPTADGAGSHALIVHDNKRAGQPRLSRVTFAPSPSVLGTFPGYKIEALECLPASTEAAVGTPEAPAQRPLKEGWLSPPPAGTARISRANRRSARSSGTGSSASPAR
ncbi:hypothetical protein OG275_33170 [Streptomyces niveus]|uniref:hypothetical protein n=1 Tax=Streptomyces niveus TaxID=193462 RepID=UPI002E35ACDE|nr:hypothetical protein [Streptomyces niveus]